MELLFYCVFFKFRKYIPQRCTMSFPEGIFWATAEKPIFKYMKYAIQHEKKLAENRCNFSLHIPISLFNIISECHTKERSPYILKYINVRTKKWVFKVFSELSYISYICKLFLSRKKSDSCDFNFYHIQVFAQMSLYPWDLPGSL